MDGLTCRIKEYIKPFERRLAIEELRAMVGGPVIPLDGTDATAVTFAVPASSDAHALRGALAYWSSVGSREDGLTVQVRGEATAAVVRNGVSSTRLSEVEQGQVSWRLPHRRCLRYGTHGLHEYRGKFFPQLVRSLMNIARLPDDAVVLDPMCGSGTTLVEARLSGRRSYGLDMNPLSVFVTDVKCSALSLDATSLTQAHDALRRTLVEPEGVHEPGRRNARAPVDGAYLDRWFAPQTLIELNRVAAAIDQLASTELRGFYRVCLSNILRGVSLQRDADLRIRRDEKSLETGETVARFLSEAARSTKMVSAFLIERGNTGLGCYQVQEGDARRSTHSIGSLIGKVDAVITSPPYATALPYIDTDRLSLIYLGLLPKEQHRLRDTLMIGNREITAGARKEQWDYYRSHRTLLPQKTCSLIDRIDRLNRAGDVGFRRRNLSTLLAKYFFDMREVMQQVFALLRPGGPMFLVVGNNRTTAGNQPIEIRTSDHLIAIAQSMGGRLTDDVPMDMLVSRDIFKKNAVPSERILRIEKAQ